MTDLPKSLPLEGFPSMTAPQSPSSVTKLLPCPFCGSEAVDRREIDGFPMIYCNGDDCFGPQTTAKSFDDALVQWNTRAGGVAQAPSREAREKEITRLATIETCARELETSYPDHAWLNAACAAIRALSVPSTTCATAAEEKREAHAAFDRLLRAKVIEECAKLIESGTGMADLIDQDDLDQQAKMLRALAHSSTDGKSL